MILLTASAFALPLVSEDFDGSALPAGWKAQGAASFEDGTLVLRAGSRPRKPLTVSKKVELRGVTWVRVQARMRSEGVTGGAADLTVRFEDGELRTARRGEGTADWVSFTRYFEVPAGARDVEVGFQLAVEGTVAFDDLVVDPVEPGWRALGRGAFVYHWLGTDAFGESQLATNDDTHDRTLALLGLSPGTPLHYHKYQDLDTIEQYTGVRAETVVTDGAIHTIFRNENHRLVQLVASRKGTPPALLAEGLPAYLAGEWDGRAVKLAARGMTSRGEAPTLATLLDPAKFAAQPSDVSHIVAGAFVDWVVAVRGQEALRNAWAAMKADASAEDNRKALEAALGVTLAEAQAAFDAGW